MATPTDSMTADGQSQTPEVKAPASRRFRRGKSPKGRKRSSPGWILFRWIVRIVVVLFLLVTAALLWLGTETGFGYALSWTQQLLVRFNQALALERVQGNLWHGMRIGRYEWRGADMVVKGRDLQLQWSLRALLRGSIQLNTLGSESLSVQLPPSQAPEPRTDLPMPGNFGLPFKLEVRKLSVGHFELLSVPYGQEEPEKILELTEIEGRAQYALGQYQVQSLTLVSPWGRVLSGQASMDAAPPHRLTGQVRADGTAQQWPYVATLDVDGDLDRLPVTIAGQLADGQAEIKGDVRPLNRMPVDSLHARIADANLARFTALGKLPETGLDLDLDIDPEKDRQNAWQGRIKLANRKAGLLYADRVPVRSLQSQLAFTVPPTEQWEQFYIGLRNLQIGLPVTTQEGANKTVIAAKREARLSGRLEVWPAQSRALPGFSLPQIKSELKLDQLDLMPFADVLPATALSGQVRLDGQQFLVDLSQDAERMRALLPGDFQRLVANARARLVGTLDDRWLKLSEGSATLGETGLTIQGQMGVGKPPHDLRFKGGVRKLDLAQWLPSSLPIDPRLRQGSVGADWSIEGQLMAPGQKAAIALDFVDTQLAGLPLTGGLRARPELDAQWQPLNLQGLALNLAHGDITRINAEGALGRPEDSLKLALKSTNLGSLDKRVAGQLDLSGNLQGRFDDLSAALQGQASKLGYTVAGETGSQSYAIQDLKLAAKAPLALQKASNLDKPLALSVSARQLMLDQQKIDRLRVDLNGSGREHRLSVVGAEGKDRLHLNSQGSLSLPREGFRYQTDLDTLDISGRASIRLNDPARLTLDAQGLQTGDLKLSVLGGTLDLVRLVLDWREGLHFDTQGRIDGVQPTQIRAVLEMDQTRNLQLLQNVRAAGEWQLSGRGADAMFGHASLSLTELPSRGKRRLGLRDNNGAAIAFNGDRMEGGLHLDLPSIGIVNAFLGPDLAVDGTASLDGTIKGKITEPSINLSIKGNELLVLQRSAGFALKKGTLDASLNNQGLVLNEMRFNAGEGSMLLKGSARLVERPLENIGSFNASVDEIEAAARRKQGAAAASKPSVLPMDGRFDVVLDRFLVPIGPGQKVTISGQSRMSSSQLGLYLTGSARVDEGLIEVEGSSAPTLPSDVQVVGEATPQDEADANNEESSLRIRSNLKIDLGEKLKVSALGGQARLGGNLVVSGFLPANPQLTGVVRVLDGSYRAYGQDLRVTKGLIRFNGPVDNPSLDIEATRPYLPVSVGVAISGLANNPKVELVSKTSMSETDKLSWLVLGVPPDEAGGAAQALALQQAGTMLFSNNSGQASPTLADRLGLDVLNYGYASNTGVEGIQESMAPKGIMSTSSSDSESAETGVVSLGKRINDRLFVSYEAGVRGVWNLLRIQYTLGKGYVARAQAGSENSIDLLRTRNFN